MTKNNINDQIAEEKLLILTSFLRNSPFEGWSNNNLYYSAKQNGFSNSYVDLIFPNKIKDLTLYFNNQQNILMNENFLKDKKNNELKTHEKIIKLIETKFFNYSKNKEAIRCLFQYNLLPQNIISAKKSLWTSCDQIWFLAGDKSTDFNYYTKRALLAYVYSTSLLYFLSDESLNQQDTSIFIRKKIQEILKIGDFKKSFMNFFKKLK
ncbi:MAG: COQ9 family protein [Pseudomonadota bacterium]